MDVDNEDRIKKKDAGGYELPTQPTRDERFNYILQRERSQLDIPPQVSFLPDLVTASPRKDTNTAHNVAGLAPVATANSSDSGMTELQNPTAIDLVALEVAQAASQALDLPTDSQSVTSLITMTDQTVVGAVIPPPPVPPQEQLSVYQTSAVFILDDDDIGFPTVTQQQLPPVAPLAASLETISPQPLLPTSPTSPIDQQISELREQVDTANTSVASRPTVPKGLTFVWQPHG